MNHDEYVEMKRKQLISVVNKMLEDKINLIDGVRQVCWLRSEIDDAENVIFYPFRGVDSETDYFLIETENRHLYDEKYLCKLDAEMAEYISNIKEFMMTACKDIVRVYGNKITK